MRLGRRCGVDVDAILARPTIGQRVVEPPALGLWERAFAHPTQAASPAYRPGGAAPALATLAPVHAAPPARPAGSTLIAAARRPVRSPGDLLRWVSIGQMVRLAPGPTLIVPA